MGINRDQYMDQAAEPANSTNLTERRRSLRGLLLTGLVEDDDLWGDLEGIDELEPEGAEVLSQAVTGMKLKCEQLQEALQHKIPGADPE
jgi:hypothetical protein